MGIISWILLGLVAGALAKAIRPGRDPQGCIVTMIIGIVGYFTVPSVANYIVHAGGGNTLLYKVSSLFSSTSRGAVNTVTGSAGMVADAMGSAAGRVSNSISSYAANSGYFKEQQPSSGGSKYMQEKISGNS